MKDQTIRRSLRGSIYTRVSTEQGLEQDFNSLDAQREACQAYIKSQAHEGWRLVRDRYDDGGYSGGSMDRPALQKLLIDVQAKRIDVIVVYKVDRLTRSLADFANLVETFDAHGGWQRRRIDRWYGIRQINCRNVERQKFGTRAGL
jgi:site-specific DNA recombinase